MTAGSTPTSQQFSALAAAAPADDVTIKRRHKPHVHIRVAPLNITSMMDLTFNLLLFFVLTASFSVGEGSLPANLPAGTGSSLPNPAATIEPPENPLVISLSVNTQNQLHIAIEGTNISATDFENLYQKLHAWQHTVQNPAGIYQPNNPILIKPDPNVPWNHVVDCFNALMRARYTKVGFAPVPGQTAP